MKLLAKFKQILYMGFRPTLNVRNLRSMVTYSVTKIIPACSLMIVQFLHTMIVASTDKER